MFKEETPQGGAHNCWRLRAPITPHRVSSAVCVAPACTSVEALTPHQSLSSTLPAKAPPAGVWRRRPLILSSFST
eukprot:5649516-Amphidinium_carterae.1